MQRAAKRHPGFGLIGLGISPSIGILFFSFSAFGSGIGIADISALAKREIFNELSKDYVSGITFSGGDPLAVFNVHFVFDLMEQIKKHFPNKTIWVYTGYTFEELEECVSWTHAGVGRYSTYDEGVAKILPLIDVLVDGEYKKDLRDVNLKWRGSSNQRVIDVQKSLKEGKVVLHCE